MFRLIINYYNRPEKLSHYEMCSAATFINNGKSAVIWIGLLSMVLGALVHEAFYLPIAIGFILFLLFIFALQIYAIAKLVTVLFEGFARFVKRL